MLIQCILLLLILAEITVSESIAITAGETGIDEGDAFDEQTIKEACDELTDHFKHRVVESLLRATRFSLDVMRKRFFSRLFPVINFPLVIYSIFIECTQFCLR